MGGYGRQRAHTSEAQKSLVIRVPPAPPVGGSQLVGHDGWHAGSRSTDLPDTLRMGAGSLLREPKGRGMPPQDVVQAMMSGSGQHGPVVAREASGEGSVQRPPPAPPRHGGQGMGRGDSSDLDPGHGIGGGRQSPASELLDTLGFEDRRDDFGGGGAGGAYGGSGRRGRGFGGGYRAILFGNDDGDANAGGGTGGGSKNGARRASRTRSRSSRQGTTKGGRSQRRPSHRSQRSNRSHRSGRSLTIAAPASDSDEPDREATRDSDSPNDGRRLPHALYRLWNKDAPRPHHEPLNGTERQPSKGVDGDSHSKERRPRQRESSREGRTLEADDFPFLQQSPSYVGSSRRAGGVLA